MLHGKWKAGSRALMAVLVATVASRVWSADPAAPSGSAPTGEAADRVLHAKARAAMDKGLSWLQRNQKENGAWSNDNFPGLTALGLWAATQGGLPGMSGVCERAAAYVASFAQPDGGIYKPASGERGSGGLSTYNTAICMTALHRHDRNKYMAIILKARQFMAASQLQGDSPGAGGFGYDRTPPSPPDKTEMERRIVERARREGKPEPDQAKIAATLARLAGTPREARADLSNTGWALMAMRATQDVEDARPGSAHPVDIDWSAALRYVEKLQNKDADDPENRGGFGYVQGGDRGGTAQNKDGGVTLRGFGSMTYAGIESMIYAQVDRGDPRIQSAVQWASRHWSVDENPGMGAKGLFYYYNILAKSLNVVGSDVLRDEKGQPIPWRELLMEKLVSVQQADGSWANADNTFWENDPALVTAYAVLTLEYAFKK